MVKSRELQNKERQEAIEVGEKCCMCFPIKCGLMTLAILNTIGVLIGFVTAVMSIVVFNVVGLILLLIAIPNFYSGYLSLMWACRDNAKTRAGLTLALQIELFYYFLSGILYAIRAVLESQKPGEYVPILIAWCIGFLLIIYFMSATRAYQVLNGDIIEEEELQDVENFAQ